MVYFSVVIVVVVVVVVAAAAAAAVIVVAAVAALVVVVVPRMELPVRSPRSTYGPEIRIITDTGINI